MWRSMGNTFGVAECLEALVSVGIAAEEEPEPLARLLAFVDALRARSGIPLPPAMRPQHDHCVAVLRAWQGQDALEAAWAEGRAMTLEQAIAYALDEAA